MRGARQIGVVDEENVYLDRDGELTARDESLRLRRDESIRLTWKGASHFHEGILSRPEIEVSISSFADALQILERLGFREIDRLAKRRETWQLQDIQVTLDTTAFGQFVELEGDAASIATVARALGLDVRQGLPSSYRKLQRERRPAGGV